jgi:uncharacterized protein with von Willebrand factor type A (vWA) domain
MQRCTVMVRLGGDLLNTVEKFGVSPAEIMLLRHIHGDDSVAVTRLAGNDRGVAVNERERLQTAYPTYFKDVFGLNPKFPDTLADIGIDAYAEEGEPVEAKSTRKRKEKLAESAVTTVDTAELAEAFEAAE